MSNTSRPQMIRWLPEHLDAIDAEAERRGMTTAEWSKRRLLSGLPEEVRNALPPLAPRGRPKTAKPES